MHRIAALYDIHGNLPALQAVLRDVSESSVDQIVFGGDLCWGPMPRETLELIQTVENAQFVRGNADRSVAKGHEEGIDEWILRVTHWSHDQLELHHREFLAAQPETVIMEAEGLGDILFCHGSPRSDEESITTATPDNRLHEMLAGVEQRIVVCGHTHAQFERTSGIKRVVNTGSVGLPFGAPGAYWAVLGPEIELRNTDYDYERAAEMFLDKGGPEAQGFAEHALAPPPYETAAELWG